VPNFIEFGQHLVFGTKSR